MIGWIEQALQQQKMQPKAVTNSLFYKDKLGLTILPFDLIVDERHTLEFSASDHPLENGAVITDHITQKLRSCQITGMFTNNPIRKIGNGQTDEGAYNVSVKVDENKARQNIAQLNYLELEKIAKRREPVTLSCSVFPEPTEMIITSLSVKRSAKDGSSITFTLGLREFKVVELKQENVFAQYTAKDMGKAQERVVSDFVTNGKVSAKTKEIIENEVMARVR